MFSLLTFYKYRFWFSSGFAGFLGLFIFFYFIYPKITELENLKIKYNDLIETYHSISELPKKNSFIPSQKPIEPYPSQIALLSDVIKTSRYDSVKILSLERIHRIDDKAVIPGINLTLRGNFSSLTAFLTYMKTQLSLLVVSDFAFYGVQNTLNLSLTLYSIPGAMLQRSKKAYGLGSRPLLPSPLFCESEKITYFKLPTAEEVMTHISVREIKKIGYLRKDKKSQALLLLPNKQMFFAHQGMIIGKEHALIHNITPDGIYAKLPNKKRVMIG